MRPAVAVAGPDAADAAGLGLCEAEAAAAEGLMVAADGELKMACIGWNCWIWEVTTAAKVELIVLEWVLGAIGGASAFKGITATPHTHGSVVLCTTQSGISERAHTFVFLLRTRRREAYVGRAIVDDRLWVLNGCFSTFGIQKRHLFTRVTSAPHDLLCTRRLHCTYEAVSFGLGCGFVEDHDRFNDLTVHLRRRHRHSSECKQRLRLR
jgi:hypothetical protein